jgi:hypothetical protein
MILIGDVHGHFKEYQRILNKFPEEHTVQIGDFGFAIEHDTHLRTNDVSRHKILFGNHDDYKYVNHPHSLGHFGMYKGMFFARGAFSIDKWARMEGVSWWKEEEMSYPQLADCINEYEKQKPSIVITHDCPISLYGVMIGLNYEYIERTRTAIALEQMFNIHKPDLWVFGHHHRSKTMNILGTEFRCLAELEYYKLPE